MANIVLDACRVHHCVLISVLLFCVGAIELSILADYYGREIAAYDIQTSRCDLYGQVSSKLNIQILKKTSKVLNSSFLFCRRETTTKELC